MTEAVEIRLKYEGYLRREQKQVEEFRKAENRLLPPDLDYASITGLRLEARQKLNKVRPISVGQASRISGVSPARCGGAAHLSAAERTLRGSL